MKKPSCQGRLLRDVRWPSASANAVCMAEKFVTQICRADHLRFALFIYAKHTIKVEKSQSKLQATLPRRAYGLHSLRPHSPAEPMDPFRLASSAPSPPGEGTLPSQPSKPTKPHEQKSLPRARGRGTASAVEGVYSCPSRLHGMCRTLKQWPASIK